ncbi:hypothetical protein [Capsulimonas corticalis]|nr:hypothetical protein [Capsulimonas corticalis]
MAQEMPSRTEVNIDIPPVGLALEGGGNPDKGLVGDVDEGAEDEGSAEEGRTKSRICIVKGNLREVIYG